MAAAIVVGCGTKADNNKQTEAVPAIKSPDQDPVAYRYPIRNKDNKLVTLETNFGKMTLELYHDVAPAHADSFVARVNDGFYDSTIFHRVIAGFMIQGGDPTGTGTGNAGYTLPAEFSSLPHIEGTLSMARGPDRNSASCQFFICLGRAAHLDGQYTVFGHLIKGYDVLRAIGKVETVMDRWGREKSAPKEPVVLIHAYLSDAEGNPITPAG
ncbi:MAG: peptidylprolyl isomerase [Candidatus Zixiibacteriota bacterium]|nr:MAG: peptidylprolyl isomerase [candidate division Zixibacteria bacterium]